jgi:hypothetical protein
MAPDDLVAVPRSCAPMRSLLIAALALVPALTTLAEAQLYRWTDERGQTHMTDDPNRVPPGMRREKIPFTFPEPWRLPPIAAGTSIRRLTTAYSILWKDEPALDRAVVLMRAGVVAAEHYVPLIACMTPRTPDLMIRRADMREPLEIRGPWGIALHVMFDTGPQPANVTEA